MTDRKKEITKMVLDCFVKNGLLSTSMKDVAKDVGIQAGALYYHFKNKEDMVTQCAELAIREMSERLVFRAITYTNDIDHMTELLLQAAREYMPVMRFIVSVRVSRKYGENITAALADFSARYDSYAVRFAEKLGCDVELIKPIVYMLIVSTVNYMIFGESSLFIRQLAPIQRELKKIVSEGKES